MLFPNIILMTSLITTIKFSVYKRKIKNEIRHCKPRTEAEFPKEKPR